MTADGRGVPKYARVAATVKGQIADGTLRPGQPAPSGAALSRVTGFSSLTCRRALRILIADGVLLPGPSRNARPRVAGPPQRGSDGDFVAAARALSAGLAVRRRANGLTQPALALRMDISVTTIGHAETGRLWQSRDFWVNADGALGASGDLLRLYEAFCRAGVGSGEDPEDWEDPAGWDHPAGSWARALARRPVRPSLSVVPDSPAAGPAAALPPAVPVAGDHGSHGVAGPCDCAGTREPACVMIVWGDGTLTTVRKPEAAVGDGESAGDGRGEEGGERPQAGDAE